MKLIHLYSDFIFSLENQNSILQHYIQDYFMSFQEAGPLEEKGMVMAVLDKSFDVYMLKFGVIKRVYCEVKESNLFVI